MHDYDVSNPMMDEIYEMRRRVSERYNHNPSLYIQAMRRMQQEADSLGVSLIDYALMHLGATDTNVEDNHEKQKHTGSVDCDSVYGGVRRTECGN